MPKYTEEQLEAINKEGSNIIVSAGAGSGKTAVLSERVIRKLIDGIDIDRLLILTFTNEAAKEMKLRIRSKIIENRLNDQLDLLDSAYITTFDSYALSLVKKYHYLLNVSNNIKVIDKSVIDIYKSRIIDEIFDEYYIKNDSRFNKLVYDYCFKDDDILKHNIIRLSNSLDLKIDKSDYLNNYIDNYYHNIDWIIDDYLKLLNQKIEMIKYNVDCLKNNSKYYDKLIEVLNPLLNSHDYDSIKKNVYIQLPRATKLADEEKKYKDNINSLIKDIQNMTISSLNDMKMEILSNKENVEIILDIIKKIDSKVNKFKKKYDSYEFNDIAKFAIKIVKENEYVRNELKNYYNEIMVDEYQDTSDIQETFISLIENNNVYMVGDIKQSIYRFRNANPLIFKNKYNEYSNNNGGYKIDLTKNFRSRKEVLYDINRIFNDVMDLNIGGADYEATHQMVFGNTNYIDNDSYLEIYNYEKDKKYTKEEQEIFIVAKDIQEKINNHYQVMDKNTNKMRDLNYSDICIIMDRGTEFNKYKQIFEYLNIPLVLYKDEVLNNGIDVILIKNICNLVLKVKERTFDKEFKYYFTSVARSYLINMSDDDIYHITKDNNYTDNELYFKLKDISDLVDREDIVSFIDKIIDIFEIYDKTITVGNINETIIRLDYLKTLAKSLIDIGYNIANFVDYLNNLDKVELKYSLNTDVGNNVKIMNIHKSKGLEFPVCYYTGMHKGFNLSDLKDLIIYDSKYGIDIPYKNNYIKDTVVRTLIKERYLIDEISEKIRLFYVALTRAREKMIIVTSLTPNDIKVNNIIKMKYKSFLDILNSIYYKLSIKEVTPEIDLNYKDLIKKEIKIEDISDKIIQRDISIDNSLITDEKISKVTNSLISKKEQEIMDMGTYMHYLFEITDFKNPNFDGIEDKYKKYIISFLNQDLMKDLNCNIYKEYEFIYTDNNKIRHGFIDLMLEYDDYINIIDYKLKNTSDKHYIEQLNQYKNYIKKKTNKKVNLYLYSIIDNEFKSLDKEYEMV